MRILTLTFCLFLAFGGNGVKADPLTLSIPQARVLAQDLYRAGQLKLAHDLAQGLLKHNPKDVSALIIIAATAPVLGQPGQGRKAGQLAYKTTDNAILRYEAAQFTAKAALLEGRYALSQFWLRKTAQIAPNPTHRRQAITDFRRVRALNPWRTSLGISFAPMSNINGGSDDKELIINGIWPIGVLSGNAQALSGYRLTIDAKSSFRIRQSKSSSTHAGLRFYQTINALSKEAKALAPDGKGSDYNLSLAEISLRHSFSHKPGAGPFSIELSFGKMWFGGDDLSRMARLDFGKSFLFNAKTSANLQFSTERQWLTSRQGADTTTHKIKTKLTHNFANNDRFDIALELRKTNSDNINSDYNGAGLRLHYSLAKPIGKTSVSFGVGASMRDYSAYRVGFFRAPGGRQDRNIHASVQLLLKEQEYMGFVPTISLFASQTTSSISRFNASQVSFSFGFQSTF